MEYKDRCRRCNRPVAQSKYMKFVETENYIYCAMCYEYAKEEERNIENLFVNHIKLVSEDSGQ